MRTSSTTKLKTGLGAATLLLALTGFCQVPRAFAGITANTIDPVAVLANHGQTLLLNGPVECTAGERAWLRVTVTQRTTGAMAVGRTRFTCTGTPRQWAVQAAIQGHATFADGPATAVAVARTRDHGEATDAHQWSVNITLVTE